ncbi:MAG: Na+:solute symporter [Spirochaetes bacterium]|nr:Na+:solute symporter [Spirochaetota bacterium]
MISLLDIVIIALFFLLSLLIGVLYSRRAGKNTSEYFLAGRNLPWWLAGTAMVATTFAADTPLAVTELVTTKGIAGNWLWWNMLAGSALTIFFFAKLWHRAHITTDVEFIEIRYSGKPAAFLRGFKAIYLGVFMNCIIMGWVNVALVEILAHIFGIERGILPLVIGCMGVVAFYSTLSGSWGAVVTDFIQFIIAMSGCIILALVVLQSPKVGGIDGLLNNLPAEVFSFLPQLSHTQRFATGMLTLTSGAFVAHILVQWWASWYPGSEPGGGGYIAQRMMSAKDERHSVLSALWFVIAHYALRPWPWILVALASMVLYPDLPLTSSSGTITATKKTGFILAMRDNLPSGLLGLLVAAFLAAYMSTIATHLNWGSSYLINDFYKRFINRNGSEKHYVRASRIATAVLAAISSALILIIQSISGAWLFIIECGAGVGLVLILRWYWWRINAWSEISAMIAPFIAYLFSRYAWGWEFPSTFFFTVGCTTAAWLLVTFITKPEPEEVLEAFYRRVLPDGPGWSRFHGTISKKRFTPLLNNALNWILSIIMVYCVLFAIGKIIFKQYTRGFFLLSLAGVLFGIISVRLKKI